jgi:transcriptional regulator GlxA family with amidase domain
MTFAASFDDTRSDAVSRTTVLSGTADHVAVRPVPTAQPAMRRIGIVLYEGFSLLRAGAIAEVFQLANESAVARSFRDVSGPVYDVRMLSLSGGGVQSASSVRVWSERFDPDQYTGFDALLVAGGDAAAGGSLIQSLQGRMRFGYMDGSSAPPVYAHGLFGTQSAGVIHTPTIAQTVDPRSAPAFAPKHAYGPALNAESRDDDSAESVRSALALVKRDLGYEVARDIGERVMPGASNKLNQLLRDVSAKTVQEKVRASARWLDENCERSIAVAEAAQVAVMSGRSFSRHFKFEFGMTPSEYLLRARLDLVCRLLSETDLPVEKIARRCGIGSGDRLGKIFRKRLKASPTEYRLRSRITL